MLYLRRSKLGWASLWLVTFAAACGSSGSDKPDVKPEGRGSTTAAAKPGSDKAPAAANQDPSPSGGAGETVPASELEYTEMKVAVDKAEGSAEKDAFNYFRVWGEVKNKSSKWVEQIRGDIRYFDASGKELKIDSIGTAVKEDVGDKSPGEPVSSDVMYIPPGGTVPLHHIRSLNKIGGTYGSYKITLRPAHVVTKHPDVSLEGMQDVVANVPNEAIGSTTPNEHRVISGTLRNKGDLGCRNPGLVLAFYDASGKLADVREESASKEVTTVLAPGATMPVKAFTLVGSDEAWKAKATMKTWGRCSEPY